MRRSLLALLFFSVMHRGVAQAPRFSETTFWGLQRLESPDISPDGKQILYTRWTANQTTNRWEPFIVQIDVNGEHVSQLGPGFAAQWSSDGTRIAYLTESDGRRRLMIRTLAGSVFRQATRDTDAPEEFHWSPDGKEIAFTQWVPSRNDSTGAFADRINRDLPGSIATLFGASGQARVAGTRRHLFVVSADSGVPRQLTSGSILVGARHPGATEPASFSWFPDGRNIAFDGNDSPTADIEYPAAAIYFVEVSSGKTGRLTANRGFWHSPVVSPDGRWVAYTGFIDNGESYRPEALYITSTDGSTTRGLTPTLERDPVSVHWAPDNLSLWFSAEDRGTINIFNVTTAATPILKTATNGTHAMTLGPLSAKDGGFAVAVRSRLMEPGEIVRFALKRPAELKAITKVNQAALAGVRLGEVEELSFQSAGFSLQGYLFRPPGFDAAGKYPLVVEVHEGPFAMFSAAFDPAVHLLSALDYLVLRVNPRGSTGFGMSFGNVSANAFPGAEANDILAGVAAAVATGSVDSSRVYLDGCGAGAISALHLLTTTSQFARASLRCTGGEWLSLSLADRAADFDTPFFSRPVREDPLVWSEHSPLRYASSIRAPVLILAGRCDLDAPFALGRSLFSALQSRQNNAVLMQFDDECRGTTTRPGNWVRTMRARMEWYR